MKRILCIILATVMVFSMLPFGVLADGEENLGVTMDGYPLDWICDTMEGQSNTVALRFDNGVEVTDVEVVSGSSLTVSKEEDGIFTINTLGYGETVLRFIGEGCESTLSFDVGSNQSGSSILVHPSGFDGYPSLGYIGWEFEWGVVYEATFHYSRILEMVVTNIEVLSGEDVISFEKAEGDNFKVTVNKAGECTVHFSGENFARTETIVVEESIPVGPPAFDELVRNFYTRRICSEEYSILKETGPEFVNMIKLENNTLWFMAEEGFTFEEASSFAAEAVDGEGNVLEDKAPVVSAAERGEGSGIYDVKIVLALPDHADFFGGYRLSCRGLEDITLDVALWGQGVSMYFSKDGVDYVLGYVANDNEDVYSLWSEQANLIWRTWEKENENNGYIDEFSHTVNVASYTDDEMGMRVFEHVEGAQVKVTNVWLEPFFGSADTFRLLDENGNPAEWLISPKDSSFSTVIKEGYSGDVMLWANATVTMPDGEVYAGRVGIWLGVQRQDSYEFHYEDDIAKDEFKEAGIDTLTEYLSYIADNYVGKGHSFRRHHNVYLGSGTFTEDIVIDSRFGLKDWLFIYGASGEDVEPTTIVGGIDLNRAEVYEIRDIHFVSPETNGGEPTKALYNGQPQRVTHCSFYNYDVAVEHIAPLAGGYYYECAFVNNDIAWHSNATDGFLQTFNGGHYNSFINNRIAVWLECVNTEHSAYYFRMTDNNFLGNGTDFKTNTGSTLYMYRNYFGFFKDDSIQPGKYAEDKHNSVEEMHIEEIYACKNESISKYIKERPAIFENEEGSAVIANPRWKYPVKEWGNVNNKLIYDKDTAAASEMAAFSLARNASPMAASEEEYEDILVVDWANETTIINSEADELLINAEAFEATEGMSISVVDDDELVVGTWSFSSSDIAAEDDFNAGISVEKTDDAIEVTIADSDVLAAKNAQLFIPCDDSFNGAKLLFDGTAGAVEYADGGVSFAVAKGGTYYIVKGAEPARTVEPGCTEDGAVIYEYAGQEFAEVIPAAGHDFSAGGETCGNCDEPNPDFVPEEEPTPDPEPTPGPEIEVVPVPKPEPSPEPTPNPEPDPEPSPEPEVDYSDVDEDDWFYDEVKFIAEKGLMNGIGNDEFAPGQESDRAMVVTILWRMAGCPEADGNGFSDVPEGQWYSEAVRWAASVGIVTGYGDGTFGIGDNITREQFAVMLYRYAIQLNGEGKADAELSFNDANKVSSWAYEACAWCYENGILTGKPGNILDPQGTATRAELATMLYRFLNK